MLNSRQMGIDSFTQYLRISLHAMRQVALVKQWTFSPQNAILVILCLSFSPPWQQSGNVFQIYCDFSIQCGPGRRGGWSLVFSSRMRKPSFIYKGSWRSGDITTLYPRHSNSELAWDAWTLLASNAKPLTQVMLSGFHDYENPGWWPR